jgi:SSS family solute:Na+ symporter
MTPVIVGLYLLGMLLIGVYASKNIKDKDDFLLAGRRLGIGMASATLAATMLGGGFVIGGGEWGFTYGVSGVWMGVGCGVAILLIGLVTAQKMRALALYTVPQYLEMRYESKNMKLIASTLSLVAIIGIVAAQIVAAKAAVTILGIDPIIGSVIVALVFILYTSAAGMWAVTLTDFVQLILAIIVVLIGTFFIINQTGGLSNFYTQAVSSGIETSRFFSLTGAGGKLIFLFLTGEITYALIGQEFYQRAFSTKDATTARSASIIGGLILIVFAIFPTFVGMSAKVLYSSEIQDPAMAIPYVVQKIFSPVIGGIFIAAILAAIMSSADSMLTAGVSHIINDFGLGAGERYSEKDILKISKITTAAIGVLGLLIALMVPSVIDILMYSYLFYTGGIFVPVIGGLYWKHATYQGALAAIIVGLLLVMLGAFGGVTFLGLPSEMLAIIMSFIAFVAVSVMTKKKDVKINSGI